MAEPANQRLKALELKLVAEIEDGWRALRIHGHAVQRTAYVRFGSCRRRAGPPGCDPAAARW